MNEYLAEKILKEYEIKCESNKKFPYLMLFNTVFACFFLVLSCIYVFNILLSGKISCWFYVLGIFVIFVILLSHIVMSLKIQKQIKIFQDNGSMNQIILPNEYTAFLQRIGSLKGISIEFIKDCFADNYIRKIYNYLTLIDIIKKNVINISEKGSLEKLLVDVKNLRPNVNEHKTSFLILIVGVISYPALDPVYKCISNAVLKNIKEANLIDGLLSYGINVFIVILMIIFIIFIALIIDKLFIRGDYNKRNTINNMLDNMVLLINQR